MIIILLFAEGLSERAVLTQIVYPELFLQAEMKSLLELKLISAKNDEVRGKSNRYIVLLKHFSGFLMVTDFLHTLPLQVPWGQTTHHQTADIEGPTDTQHFIELQFDFYRKTIIFALLS